MLRSWEELPLLKVVLLFILGLIIGNYLWFDLRLMVISFYFLICILFLFRPRSYTYALLNYHLLLLMFFLLGAWRMGISNDKMNGISRISESKASHFVVSIDETRPAKRSSKHVATLIWTDDPSIKIKNKTKLVIYSKIAPPGLLSGSTVLIQSEIKRVLSPENPHQFDYGKYLRRKNVAGTSFLHEQTRFAVLEEPPRPVDSFRGQLENILTIYLKNTYVLAVCNAILFGEKDNLDEEEMDRFRKNGVAHIMAVSGMHVGIIFGLIWAILGKIRARNQFYKLLRMMVAVGLIWSFIGVCGFPPSAVRAGVMFTFLLLGKALYLRTSGLNLLAGSAITLLCVNPLWIYNVGFQFSYAAVAGIMLFYSPMDHLFNPPFRLLKWTWSLIAISCSAQLFLLPISVYYFYGFSPWFWLNSIPASLLVTCCMSLSISILTFHFFFPTLANITGSLLSASIKLFRSWLDISERFPSSYLDNIGIDSIDLVFFIVFIFSLVLLFYRSTNKTLFISFCIASIIFLRPFLKKEPGPVIYPLYHKDGWALFIKQNTTKRLITSVTDEKELSFLIKGFAVKKHLLPAKKIMIFENDRLVSLPGIDLFKIHSTGNWDPIHGVNCELLLWWADGLPPLEEIKESRIKCVYLLPSNLKAIDKSDLSDLTAMGIEIKTPGDPYYLQ